MMYKAFAAITLIAAPIITFVAQGIAPHQSSQPPVAAAAPQLVQPAPAVAPAPPPIVSSAAPVPEPVAFGQPMPKAGKPFLAPGQGLPNEAPTPPAAQVNDGSIAVLHDRDE